MRILIAMAAAALLAGCGDTKMASFFGSDDPCVIGSGLHAGFITVASKRVSQDARDAERIAYAAFRNYCGTGAFDKPTLQRALDAYTAAVEEAEKG